MTVSALPITFRLILRRGLLGAHRGSRPAASLPVSFDGYPHGTLARKIDTARRLVRGFTRERLVFRTHHAATKRERVVERELDGPHDQAAAAAAATMCALAFFSAHDQSHAQKPTRPMPIHCDVVNPAAPPRSSARRYSSAKRSAA